MSVTMEKIEELRKRAKISYEDAKILLEKHNGNVVEAVIELEKSKKIEAEQCCHIQGEGFSKIKKLFHKGNRIKFLVTRKGETVVRLPLNYLIFSLVFGFHLMIVSLIIIFVTGCKISIEKAAGEVLDVDDAIVDVAHKVKTSAENFAKDHHSKTEGVNLCKEKKEFNEHTVE